MCGGGEEREEGWHPSSLLLTTSVKASRKTRYFSINRLEIVGKFPNKIDMVSKFKSM